MTYVNNIKVLFQFYWALTSHLNFENMVKVSGTEV